MRRVESVLAEAYGVRAVFSIAYNSGMFRDVPNGSPFGSPSLGLLHRTWAGPSPLVFLQTDPDRKRQLQMLLTAQLPE